GTPAAASVSLFGPFTRPGGAWTNPGGDILPQNCVAGSPVPTFTCPATPRKLETQDANVRGNVVFRNGKIWYAQTVALPAGGITVNSRTAAQWTALTPTSPTPTTLAVTFNDGGRVEDPTATATNGGKWYAYPSIAVNKNEGVLLGYSEFESDDFVDAAYSFREAGDAAGTMRDPVVYKDGEDYYEKTFGGTRNRFGDYSHTVVDPANDTDLWTVQEYAQPRVVAVPPDANNPANGLGANSSRWSTWWAKVALAVPGALGDLVISEYRLRGTGGDDDEYVEIYNKTNSAITVTTTDGSAGYALAASDGIVRFTIPNGTTIPARGHYLGVNSDGYSLTSYPAGTATTATGDATYTTGIEDLPPGAAGCTGTLVSGRGIALFNTATTANFSTATRFDAAGSVCETNTLYKEGTGHAVVINGAATQNAWVRDQCGKGGNPATGGNCPSGGAIVDNHNNATDFFFVDTDGLPLGPPQKLGAPGPENLSSPRLIDEQFGGFLLDATKSSTASPNRFRNAADTGTNKTFGTMELRRRIVNNTGGIVTRLRFRVIDTTTFPPVAGSGRADLRALTSTDLLVGPVNDAGTCAAVQAPPSTSPVPPCSVTVRGLTLETPPLQPNGGGFNSSLSADSVTITPLAPGQSINIRILLGVQATGIFRFFLTVEALP
nr:lamin tail domain-containing protein [Acidobacteriota bacterium]